jgi:hypothetical protein
VFVHVGEHRSFLVLPLFVCVVLFVFRIAAIVLWSADYVKDGNKA